MSKNILTFEREALSVLEDGNTKTRKITVQLNNNGTFFVALPAHVSEALGLKDVIEADTLMEVIQEYEADCDAFSRWRLGKMAKPMLLFVTVEGPSKSEGISHSIGIGLHEVLVEMDDETGTPKNIYKRTDNPARLGARIVEPMIGSWFGSLFEDTSDVRAKFKELADSIEQAADALNVFADVSVMGREQQFLSISYTDPKKPAAEPVQTELPLNTPSPTNPEDEEL